MSNIVKCSQNFCTVHFHTHFQWWVLQLTSKIITSVDHHDQSWFSRSSQWWVQHRTVWVLTTLHPVGVQSTAISMSVCLSNCTSHKPHVPISQNVLHMILVAICSLLLWWQCMLCTSRFAYDVKISQNGANEPESKTTPRFIEFARWRHCGKSCRLVWKGFTSRMQFWTLK